MTECQHCRRGVALYEVTGAPYLLCLCCAMGGYKLSVQITSEMLSQRWAPEPKEQGELFE